MSEFEDSLDTAERKVVEAIELAATMSAQLAARAQVAPDGGAAASEAACRRTQEQFLQRVREAKDIMTVQSHRASSFRPLCRSTYGVQTDGSISDAKVNLVRDMLGRLEATASAAADDTAMAPAGE